jgi:hypothetical protein
MVSQNGDERVHSTPETHTQAFLEAECSCGETFGTEADVYGHLNEVGGDE